MFFSFFSLFDLQVTIQATYLATLVCIAILSYCVAYYYGKEAMQDTIKIILFSLGALVVCVWLLGTNNILVAVFAGVFSGELLGILMHELISRYSKRSKK